MSSEKIISKNITSRLQASVISAAADTRLDQSLWAINWFDLKRKWVYDLYNRLVFSHVLKVGGQPAFKGELERSILESERLRRDMLLIVKYPRALSFLQLISSKLFQLKGTLRASSVRHFQFGFMRKEHPVHETPKESVKYTGQLKYSVHICEGNTAYDFQSLINFAASLDVFPYFIGRKAAMLGLQKEKSSIKTLDFMLSHVLVFSGFDSENLETFVQSDFYQQFFSQDVNHFAGLYSRKI